MDSLIRLGDDRLDAQQKRSLGGPVTTRAHAVVLATDDHQRDASRLVGQRSLVHGLDVAIGEVGGEAAFGFGCQLVANSDVGEGPPGHHPIIAAPRSVGVEHRWFDPEIR